MQTAPARQSVRAGAFGIYGPAGIAEDLFTQSRRDRKEERGIIAFAFLCGFA